MGGARGELLQEERELQQASRQLQQQIQQYEAGGTRVEELLQEERELQQASRQLQQQIQQYEAGGTRGSWLIAATAAGTANVYRGFGGTRGICSRLIGSCSRLVVSYSSMCSGKGGRELPQLQQDCFLNGGKVSQVSQW